MLYMVDKLIQTISIKLEIKCKRCGYEGPVTATKEYYTDCPECDELVYVGCLTGVVK